MRTIGALILLCGLLAPGHARAQVVVTPDTTAPILTPSVRAGLLAAVLLDRSNLFQQPVAIEFCSFAQMVRGDLSDSLLDKLKSVSGVHVYPCDLISPYAGPLVTIHADSIFYDSGSASVAQRTGTPSRPIVVQLRVRYPGMSWFEDWVMVRGMTWVVTAVRIGRFLMI